MLFLVVCLQVFLLKQVEHFICGKSVHDIRESYDVFEKHMYTNHTLTVNGKHRGVDGTFLPENFNSLPADAQSATCRIPMSQPKFFIAILFIWTMTCFLELKKALQMLKAVVWDLPRVTRMKSAMKDGEEPHTKLLVGLTLPVKVLVFVLVMLPRIIVTLWLLWLGCRWLLSTDQFCDLILNAVALEFILLLKESMYQALVPFRTKMDVTQTKIHVEDKKQDSGVMAFLGAFVGWGLLAITWVLLYIYHFQAVLPGYKFDVHDVCIEWVKERFAA